MFTGSRIGDRRVFDYGKLEPPTFAIQEWRGCDCPDCPSDGHWQTLKRTDDKRLAHMIVDNHNRVLVRATGA